MDGTDRSEPSRIRRVPLTPDGYDQRWTDLAAAGAEVHGEADLVDGLVRELGATHAGPILDAGCGTGRVAIELARRGHVTVGVDVDPALLDRARAKAPDLEWHLGDLAALPADVAPGPFVAAVLAGNVMIFVARGTEGAVLTAVASRVSRRAGSSSPASSSPGGSRSADYDAAAAAAGLTPVHRFATWDRDPFVAGGDYVVAVDSKR